MGTLTLDLKHSLRLFGQSPGFTAAAVAALALGIGANTAVFSVVNAVLLKPVAFHDPDRVVMFMNTSPQGSGRGASPAKFQHWRAQTSVVQDVSAFYYNSVNLTGGDIPEQLRCARVTPDYFRLFGAPVLRGRTFTESEGLPNGGRVAVLSYGLWARRFGSDPKIIGRTLSLSGEPFTVVGIIGRNFDVRDLGDAPDIWIPFQIEPNTTDQGHYFLAAGRLRPGVSLKQAQARMRVAADEYRRRFPVAMRGNVSFSVEPLREALAANVRPVLLVLQGAVAFVLLIACANVANLLLARAVTRRREIAIRAAIGAGRGRIVRQLLTESVLLSLAGAVLGLVLGVIGIRALLMVNTANLPRVGQDGGLVSLDWRVVMFTVLVAVGTGLVFGLVPALHSSRPNLSETLKESGGRSGSGFRHNKARTVLVVSEVALAVILLIGAALLVRTSLALNRVDPGFDAHNVLTMRMSLTGPRFEQTAGVERVIRDGTERLRALPGVASAAATCCVPLEGGYGLPFIIVGRPLDGPFHGGGGWLTIAPGYFDVFKIRLLRGRTFTERDVAGSQPVAIINEAMARQFWPKGDPLSDRIWIGKGVMKELTAETPRQIIGVVSDIRDGGLNNDPQPTMYVPNAQVPDALNALNVQITPIAWVVRTHADPRTMSAAIQEQLRQATGLPVARVRTMEEVISISTSRQRFNMLLMTVFAGVALVLASIGIYGLMSYSVQQRTNEIGIRLALGAGTGDVQRMVVFQGVRLAIAGVVIGLAAAFGLTRLIASLLFGVQARDPMVFTAVPVVLGAVALVAVWLPAIRAARVDPLTALRYE